MRSISRKPILFFLLLVSGSLFAQDDLETLFGADSSETQYTIATFKSTRVINGQSVELPPAGEMIFAISHHFGRINSGIGEFFGLDESTVRLGLEYGLSDRLGLAIGRSSFNKMVDGAVKVRLLRQQRGGRNIPLTAVWYSSLCIKTAPWADPVREYLFAHRISYTHQLLLARKINSSLSLQLAPTWVHYNMVPLRADPNDIPALGLGGRYKVLPRLTVNAEYYLVPEAYRFAETDASFSVGFDLETGGHVFQLFFTNSMAIYDPGFIAETYGDWSKGDVFFGFNITRVFSLKD